MELFLGEKFLDKKYKLVRVEKTEQKLYRELGKRIVEVQKSFKHEIKLNFKFLYSSKHFCQGHDVIFV